MRVTSDSQYRSMMYDINNLLADQVKLQQQLLSERKVNRPSDANGMMVTILRDHLDIDRIEQYGSNLENADTWLRYSEENMSAMSNVLSRAMTLAEQLSTGTYSASEYQGSASEVAGFIDELIVLANTTLGEEFIFGGTRNDSKPVTDTLSNVDQHDKSYDGHGTVAAVIEDPDNPGQYILSLARDTGAFTDVIDVYADNSLGEGPPAGPIDFDNWSPSDATSAAYYTSDSIAAANLAAALATTISSLAGEELRFVAEGGDTQVYRTESVITVPGTGPVQVNIGGTDYPGGAGTFTTAAELANLINADGGADYFAWVDPAAPTEVHVVGTGTGSFDVTQVAGLPADIAIDNTTSFGELQTALNSGVASAGMVHLAGAPADPANETVTLGDDTWSWSEIEAWWTGQGNPAPASAGDWADALAGFVNNQTDAFTATAVSAFGGASATVQVVANAAGAMNNLQLSTSGSANIQATGMLFGGLDGTGTATDGALYVSGTSDLDLDTQLQCEVVRVSGSDVTVRVSWHDTDGDAHSEEVTLSGGGEANAVSVPGLGGISLYRNDKTFAAGAAYDIGLSRYRGNTEDLEVSFSANVRMRYNYNAQDLLGGSMTVDLAGGQARPDTNNTSTGVIHLDGVYREHLSRDYRFEVLEGGSVAGGGDVSLRVRWTDSSGVEQMETVTLSDAGQGGRVALPGADGAYIWVDNGDFTQSDGFGYEIEKQGNQVIDMLTQWQMALESADPAALEQAQTACQRALEELERSMENIIDNVADVGTRRERITIRSDVMEERNLRNTADLENLEQVDMTAALMELQLKEEAYSAALNVTSMVSDLFLLSYIG